MIDKQLYINALRKCAKEHDNDRTSTGHIRVSDLCRDTANLLEALEQEPKTGYWIRVDKEKLKCSKCEVTHFIAQYPHGCIDWCPNCGARMVEPQESEKWVNFAEDLIPIMDKAESEDKE